MPVQPEERTLGERKGKVRPRVLYTSMFTWNSFAGGRFLAPFLESEAKLSTIEIGRALALQQLVSTVAASYGGRIADQWERKTPGEGRPRAMAMGVSFATLTFLLHGIATNSIQHTLIRIIFACFACFILPVADGVTIDFLGNSKSDYGLERLFGAISWAVANVLLAILLDATGSFRVCYPLVLCACLFVLFTIYAYMQSHKSSLHERRQMAKHKSDIGIPTEDDRETIVDSQEHFPTENGCNKEFLSSADLIKLLVTTVPGTAFLICFICIASGQAIVDGLVFLYFEDIGSSYTMMGLTVVLTVALEIPIFRVAPKLLDKYGPGSMLLVACACYIVRVVGYSFIPEGHIAYVLALEPLHGVTFACSQASGVEFVAKLLPEGYEASGQGLVSLFRGIGSVIGLGVGGYVSSTFGPRTMYRSSACFVSLGMVIYAAAIGMYPVVTHQSVPQTDDKTDIDEEGSVELSNVLAS